jgi:acetyl-CoA acetyltransferase
MRDVWVQGAAMTRFGEHAGRSARDLVEEAVAGALRDAEIEAAGVQAAYVGNAAGGLMTGQECMRGQVVLRRTGLMGVPIVNVENACASSATALHLAWQAVAGELYDCVLVLGYEKIDHGSARKADRAINATMDLGELQTVFGSVAGREGGVYHRMLAASAAGDSTDPFDPELLALVAVKNHSHAVHNPCAHRREPVTVDDVLDAPAVAGSVTRLMCAPWSDGAACLVLSAGRAGSGRTPCVRIAASVVASGRGDDMRRGFSVELAARRAYRMAGVGPDQLDVVELYDATAMSELYLYRVLGLCPEGEVGRLLRERTTWLGGRLPVNPSGGLLARGHPMGATGAAQVIELTWQLEGRCRARQVPAARVGLAETSGGWVGSDVAVACVHVLQR